MNKELLEEIKKYIEHSESVKMWEFSSNIVDSEILFADEKRMPKLYTKILALINELNGTN